MDSLLFQPVETSGTNWTRWATSVAIHAVILALLVVVPLLVTVTNPEAPPPPVSVVQLIAPRPEIKVPVPRPPRVIPEPVRTREVRFKAPVQHIAPKKTISVPEPIELPKPELAKVEMPKLDVPNLPAPVRPAIKQPEIKLPEVKQNVFASTNPAPPAPAAPVRSIKTGGFGDPNGVQPSTTGATNKGVTLAKFGSFDLPQGSGQGSRGASGHPGNGGVAVAGFGGSTTVAGSGSSGSGHGTVQSSGFGAQLAAETPHAAAPAAPAETPVEITFKPKPAYTPEARDKGVEGEVLLEVVFSATGQIHVLRLQRGLGFGLDESARTAASQIRFRPGTRGGSPVDMKGTVHIVFALS